MNTVYALVVALFSQGAGEIVKSDVTFDTMEACNTAAVAVVESYEGKTSSRVGAFCVPTYAK